MLGESCDGGDLRTGRVTSRPHCNSEVPVVPGNLGCKLRREAGAREKI